MQFDEVVALSKLRLERSEEMLSAARSLLEAGSLMSVPNRSYYAVFYAMRAVLAFNGIDMKRHGGIIAEFRRLYIKTGIFDKRLSDIISTQFECRTDCDYDDFYVISREEALENLEDAESFVAVIKAYLEKEKYS